MKVYNAVLDDDTYPSIVTPINTAPAVIAGVTHSIVEEFSTRAVEVTVPNEHMVDEVLRNPIPVTATIVPPAVLPWDGVQPVTAISPTNRNIVDS